jgi:hypothetical protein
MLAPLFFHPVSCLPLPLSPELKPHDSDGGTILPPPTEMREEVILYFASGGGEHHFPIEINSRILLSLTAFHSPPTGHRGGCEGGDRRGGRRVPILRRC